MSMVGPCGPSCKFDFHAKLARPKSCVFAEGTLRADTNRFLAEPILWKPVLQSLQCLCACLLQRI